jgi:hypothetical protein
MNNQTNIEKLITSGKKVFTTDDLAVIWQISDRNKLIQRIKYYLRNHRLIHIYKGIYAYGEFTNLEVAQKLVPLSYVSLYTTAQIYGLTFQFYSTIFCLSLKSKKYEINGQKYEYHKVKESIFYSNIGLIKQNGLTLASKERTICYLLYVYPNFAFDNLSGVNVLELSAIASLYSNKRLKKDIASLIEVINKEGD